MSSKSRVHPQAAPHAFFLTNPRHTLLSCIILLACLTFIPLLFKQSFMVSIHLFLGLLLSDYQHTPLHRYIDSLSNPIVPHSLNIADPSENTFINAFVQHFRNSSQLFYPFIRDFIHSLRFSICTALILDLSFSFYIIVSLPKIRTGSSNDSCKTSYVPDLSKPHPKYLNSDTYSKRILSSDIMVIISPPQLIPSPCSYLH